MGVLGVTYRGPSGSPPSPLGFPRGPQGVPKGIIWVPQGPVGVPMGIRGVPGGAFNQELYKKYYKKYNSFKNP